jgi:CubicO group peptidase (beta-lactamase class C family)
MARDQIPGVAVGIVERGQLVLAEGFGYRDLDKHLPVTPDTIFSLGSASKAFTATAIALVVEDGKIALDAPVRTYLRDFSVEDPVASATMTTRDLLTHRSGLPRHDLFWYEAPFSRDELCRRVRFLESSGPAHARWRYNSLMFVVAGQIIERVAGQSWESFVQARILAPLGMHRTILSLKAAHADSNHAVGYALRDGRARKLSGPTRLDAIAPAGGVHSCVRDLARWLTFHATRSPALVGDEMWRELHRGQAEMPSVDEPEVQDRQYALGWIRENYRGHPLLLHNGSIDGFTVHLGFLPETGQGLIVLMNRDLAPSGLMAIAYSAYDRLLGLPPIDWEARLKEAPTTVEEFREVALDFPLETVVGRYEHPAYGTLMVRSTGNKLRIRFRTLHFTLGYRGHRRFLSLTPIADGAPQIAVTFSRPRHGEPLRIMVPLNLYD